MSLLKIKNLYNILAFVAILWISSIIPQQNHIGAPPTPNPTIEPTLTPDQIAFEALLQSNGGCKLPCWWGFTIGEANKDSWLNFLNSQTFHLITEEPLSNGETIPLDNSAYIAFPRRTSTSIRLAYQFEAEILTWLRITIDHPEIWLTSNVTNITLPGVLAQLDGAPAIYMFLGGASSPLSLPILVLDDESGFMAQYTFNLLDTLETPNDADTWQFCLGLENTTAIEITIQDPNAEQPVSHRIQSLIEAKEAPRWASIEDLNTTQHMRTEDFVQFFRDNPDKCLDPSEYVQEQENQ